MKKKLIVITLISLCLVFVWFMRDTHPLIGEWQSKPGEKVGVVKDPNAPYQLVFTEDEMQILGKKIKINYILTTQEKGIVFVQSKKYKNKLKIRLLESGKIRFAFPPIGLRIYERK